MYSRRFGDCAVAAAAAILLGPTVAQSQSVDLSQVPSRFIIDAEPWRASGRASAPPEVFAEIAPEGSLLDVALHVESGLRDAGHNDLGWYYVHPESNQAPGFAVVLKQQRITDDGGTPGLWTKIGWFFKGAPPSRHRLIALFFTAPPFSRTSEEPVLDVLEAWQASGSTSPFEKLGEDSADGHRLTALIYIFEQSPTSGAFDFISDTDATAHLNGTGLGRLFGLRPER